MRTSPSHSKTDPVRRALLAFCAALCLGSGQVPVPQQLTPTPTRDQKVVRRWSVSGGPHGVAAGRDGTIYVGLAQAQAVIAVDPKSGAIVKKIVLDSADIAATKELVTLRTNRDGTLLYVANGSDESATILSLPDLGVVREITIEGESIRDFLPDPAGRFLYLLGRRVHVYDATGEQEIHTLPFEEPMAIAATESRLAVIGTNDFGNAKATAVALYETTGFREVAREPLETTDVIQAAAFSPGGNSIVAVSRDHLLEKPLGRSAREMTRGADGQMRMNAAFGDLVNSNTICFSSVAGAGALALGPDNSVIFPERRCSTTGSFIGSSRQVSPASLYGVDAFAIAYDRTSGTVAATDPTGFLTIYKVPARGSRESPQAPH